jgi:hypothetical protein
MIPRGEKRLSRRLTDSKLKHRDDGRRGFFVGGSSVKPNFDHILT